MISKFITVGDLKRLLASFADLPDNAIIGTAGSGHWSGVSPEKGAQQWRIVQHRKSKKLGLIIGDATLSTNLDKTQAFHDEYNVLLGDHSFDSRLTDPEFRSAYVRKNADILDIANIFKR